MDADVLDAASGITLLYLGPENDGDEYSHRLMIAIELEDLDEVEHITALMVALMRLRDFPVDTMKKVDEAWHLIWSKNDERINGLKGAPHV